MSKFAQTARRLSTAGVSDAGPCVPPFAPTCTIAIYFGHPGIDFSAIDPVAVTRNVYRNAGGGGYFLVATISALVLFWIDFAWVTPGATLLLYKVTDENACGVSPFSNIVDSTGD